MSGGAPAAGDAGDDAGVLRHGIDVVDIARVAAMLERHGERFLARCFTGEEREGLHAVGPARRAEFLAGRFAAKEAAAKALGTGIADGVGWRDVAVAAGPRGEPELRLEGGARARSAALGVRRWALSISHAAGVATASVVGTG